MNKMEMIIFIISGFYINDISQLEKSTKQGNTFSKLVFIVVSVKYLPKNQKKLT